MRRVKILLAVVVLVGLFVALFVTVKPQIIPKVSIKNDVFGFVFENLHFRDDECGVTDTIEYFYYEPLGDGERENNKFGLYVYAENKEFIKLADELVNSKGGDWGYVLIPYNVDDRDYDKWRDVFDLLYSKHLVPIIQLHDTDDDEYEDELRDAAEFLKSFAWPVKQRYITVYNEPNDAKFWFGRVDPGGYARILDFAIDAFKGESKDFFMLNGAFNVSAANNTDSMDSFVFMSEMNKEVDGIFDKLDGWASHSYPQPNFSGSPFAVGRRSIKAYENELAYLKNTLGVKKDLPVFITETGWAHAEGENYNSSYHDVATVSENFRYAFENVWLLDERVVAVTPFTIWFEPPFDHFAWINSDKVPYEHYEVVKSIKKTAGDPQKLLKKTVELSECN